MTNLEMYTYVQRVSHNKAYMADEVVREGNGQTVGGYIESLGEKAFQSEHFLSYYAGRSKVTYVYLRCPQLIIFIAEVVGVNNDCICKAISHLKKYDQEFDKKNYEGRNGNYMWGTQAFREFKNILMYKDICLIIKKSESIDVVIERVATLNNTQ